VARYFRKNIETASPAIEPIFDSKGMVVKWHSTMSLLFRRAPVCSAFHRTFVNLRRWFADRPE